MKFKDGLIGSKVEKWGTQLWDFITESKWTIYGIWIGLDVIVCLIFYTSDWEEFLSSFLGGLMTIPMALGIIIWLSAGIIYIVDWIIKVVFNADASTHNEMMKKRKKKRHNSFLFFRKKTPEEKARKIIADSMEYYIKLAIKASKKESLFQDDFFQNTLRKEALDYALTLFNDMPMGFGDEIVPAWRVEEIAEEEYRKQLIKYGIH